MTQKNLDAKDKAGIRPRSERKRYLNVIYFIDSNRTRTLKFSIRTSYLTVGTLGLLVTWSLVASLLLVREHGLNTELRSRSRSLLSVIFNYQTRYDQVYEKAYPNDTAPVPVTPGGTDAAPSLTAQAEEEGDEDDGKTSHPNSAKAAAVAALAARTPTLGALANDNSVSQPKEKIIATAIGRLPTGEPPIAVENFSSALHDETLTVRFSLKNTNKGNKATGMVTAQARFFENGKEGIWLATQNEGAENMIDTGDQDDPSSDQHFNIRYYKNKVFHFATPTKRNGLFTAVKIQVKDEQGRIKEFAFPLTKEPRVQQSRLEEDETETDDVTTPQ